MQITKRILIIFIMIVIAVFSLVYCIWHNELSTITSLELIRQRDGAHNDGAVYAMNVKGGFYLDDFIRQGGVKSDAELIEFITGKISRGIIDFEINSPEIGCASFTAADKTGNKLLARNYDFYETNTCIVFTKGKNERHSTISTVDLTFLGIDPNKNIESMTDKIYCLAAPYVPLDGINDAGVSCGINMSYQGGEKGVSTNQNTNLPDITSTTLLRLILDYADTVDEAVEIAKSYDMHDSANMSFEYIVADAAGNSAILQWLSDTSSDDVNGETRKLYVLYNMQDSDIGDFEAKYTNQVNTNFVLKAGYYANAQIEKHGYDRYLYIWEQLSENNGIIENSKAAMDILASVGARKWYEPGTAYTVHSVVYNMTDRTALWVPNEHYDDENAYYEFRFKE